MSFHIFAMDMRIETRNVQIDAFWKGQTMSLEMSYYGVRCTSVDGQRKRQIKRSVKAHVCIEYVCTVFNDYSMTLCHVFRAVLLRYNQSLAYTE